jgi:hypothetical protein
MVLERGRHVTALALSLLYPGLGHLYVRSWYRALGWYLGGLVVLLAVSPDALSALLAARTVEAALLASRSMPVGTLVVVLLGSRVLGTADVWWLLRRRTGNDGTTHCDSCSRARDPDVAFCPWCLDATDRQ